MSTAAISLPGRRLSLGWVALLFILPFLAGCGFNTIPTNEERAKAAWSEVLNQYQRRADLIPNLVETVKAFAQQEREVLEAVVNARARATSINVTVEQLTDPEALRAFQEAQSQLTGALSRLLAVAENYPNLTSGQNFLALQSQLEGTENRIAVARRDYIEAVRVYNTSLRTFPSVLWASLWFTDNEPMANFTVEQDRLEVPQVNFGTNNNMQGTAPTNTMQGTAPQGTMQNNAPQGTMQGTSPQGTAQPAQ